MGFNSAFKGLKESTSENVYNKKKGPLILTVHFMRYITLHNMETSTENG